MLWKVLIHMVRATGPTRPSMRSFISPAALLVKVMATTSSGRTCSTWSSQATRCVSTRVLPEPAPARMSSGPVDVRDRLALLGVEAGEQRVVGLLAGPGRRRRHPMPPPSTRLMTSAMTPARTSLRPESHSRSRDTEPRKTPEAEELDEPDGDGEVVGGVDGRSPT